MRLDKSILLRWCLWFFVGNIILFWLIGWGYLSNVPWVDTPYLNSYGKHILKAFAAFAFMGQLGFLAVAPVIIPLFLTCIFPRRQFIFTISILLATCSAMLLAIDVVTYKLYHFHLNGLILDIMAHGMSEEVFGLSWSEYVVFFSVLSIILLAETGYAIGLWRYLISKPKKTGDGWLGWTGLFLGLSLYMSYTVIVYSAGTLLVRAFIDVGHLLPLYTETFGAIIPVKNGRILIERLSETCLVQPKKINAPLNYPLHDLKITPQAHPKNLLFIVVDTWRFDMLNKDIMPNLSELSKDSWVFTNHFSGGNATGPGIFSLFYGLPVSYWTSMSEQHRGPLLIDELLKQHYQTGIFGSASLRLPAFNETVFSAIKNLKIQTQGKSAYARDSKITQEFKDFIAEAVKHPQPFFGFLFYDAAHSYCTYDEDLLPLQPAIKNCNRVALSNSADPDPLPYLNRYKNALILVDQQIKQVIHTLAVNHLLDNTIIVITGDHGEEFNDNHQGYWGHASNFTRYQVQTPLIIHWPGKKPQVFAHQTTHFDIVPTLMQQMLGCQTKSLDYSLGRNLFDKEKRSYLIVGSYVGLGVLEPDRITNISQTGNFIMQKTNGQQSREIKLDLPVITLVFHDMRRFYKS